MRRFNGQLSNELFRYLNKCLSYRQDLILQMSRFVIFTATAGVH